MNNWNKVFEINKKLDETFMKKYLVNEPMYYEKNCLGLTVEIAELANETKCFKYWSVKKINRAAMLDEYADTITMILSIFTYLNIELKDIEKHSEINDIIILLNELFNESTNLFITKDIKLAKLIFSNLLHLGDLLEISNKEKLDACYKKMNIIEERLNSNY